MYIIGIDPGARGALVLLDADTNRVEHYADMPAHDVTVAGQKRKSVDPHGLANIIRSWDGRYARVFGVLEQVASMPKQGVASTFAFGRASMAPEAAMAALEIPFNLVRPNVWKKVMQCSGDKDDARRRASQLLPKDAHLWPNKKDADRAEAALLAVYGARVYAVKSSDDGGGLLE